MGCCPSLSKPKVPNERFSSDVLPAQWRLGPLPVPHQNVDILAKGPVLTSLRWDRLACWNAGQVKWTLENKKMKNRPWIVTDTA
ncbi:Nebulette [Manis pentadactyla]|nr:Nebulette [Manis pentadactyla]